MENDHYLLTSLESHFEFHDGQKFLKRIEEIAERNEISATFMIGEYLERHSEYLTQHLEQRALGKEHLGNPKFLEYAANTTKLLSSYE